MIFISTILIFSVLIPAFVASKASKIQSIKFGSFLVFAGSYLFSISIVHILPELFISSDHTSAGLFVLAGFFFQQILEYFSTGVEHGHMHTHKVGQYRPVVLLSAMVLHSVLEGTLLAHPSTLGTEHSTHGLLLGIVLHKIPASIALMVIFLLFFKNNTKAWIYIAIFSLASPLGLISGDWFLANTTGYEEHFSYLFAFVCGSFLHISTTIVFETSPEHKFNFTRFIVTLLGAIAAVVTEYII